MARPSPLGDKVIDFVQHNPGVASSVVSYQLKLQPERTYALLARGVRSGLLVKREKKFYPVGAPDNAEVQRVVEELRRAVEEDVPIEEPVKRPRKKLLLQTVRLPEFKTLCAGLDLTLEQGLALGYRLILNSLKENVR